MAEFQSVKTAVRDYLTEWGHIATAVDLAYRLAPDFGISENSRAEHVAFQGQVRRALEQLVDEAVLVRDRGGQPDYRTKAYDEKQREANAEAARIAQELREAWDGVHARIRKLGINPQVAGPVISLDLDSWGLLLSYAERGYV